MSYAEELEDARRMDREHPDPDMSVGYEEALNISRMEMEICRCPRDAEGQPSPCNINDLCEAHGDAMNRAIESGEFWVGTTPWQSKRCSECRVAKMPEEFSRNRNSKSGLQSTCRLCQARRRKEYTERCRQESSARVVAETRFCSQCCTIKKSDEFSRAKTNPSGIQVYCKPCSKEKKEIYLNTRRRNGPPLPTPQSKPCVSCGEDKTYVEFGRNKLTRDGLESSCKGCIRGHRRRRTYGLDNQAFRKVIEQQDGRCAICRVAFGPPGPKPYVDHSHESGAVRGVLCRDCNTGLGCFRDDPARLVSAMDYLAKVEPARPAPRQQGVGL